MERAKPLKRKRYEHGNYEGYYSKRYSQTKPTIDHDGDMDPRLKLVKASWFKGKECLDVGCNSGVLTIALARKFRPKTMVGIDIDATLICLARKALLAGANATAEESKKGVNVVEGHLQLLPRALRGSASKGGQGNYDLQECVSFRQEDFLAPESSRTTPESSLEDVEETYEGLRGGEPLTYDIVTMFSVIKWIHLNGGDRGVERAFRRVHALLRPGGYLVLEPQAWKSYRKSAAKHGTATAKANLKEIRLRPEDFPALLTGDIGFKSCEDLGAPTGADDGFADRHLYLFMK